jgi:hypothetical protein
VIIILGAWAAFRARSSAADHRHGRGFGGFYFSTDYKDIIALVLLVVTCPSGRRASSPKGAR